MLSNLKVNKKNTYVSFIAVLFYFFFMSPALSPAINGNTIYLYWLIPFFDTHFDEYLIKYVAHKIKGKYYIGFLLVTILCITNKQMFLLVKIMTIVFSLFYLSYSRLSGTFKYLYWGLNLNIFIAVLQFIFYYISPQLAYSIGPSNISSLLWGGFATDTNTNFYAIFGSKFIRVCGWSREAGFFASLLSIVFIEYHFCETHKKKMQYVLFAIGYIISFSKFSLLLIPMILVCKYSKYINKCPYIVAFISWVLVTSVVANYLKKNGFYVASEESLFHRFVGYSLIWELPLNKVLFGFGDFATIRSSLGYSFSYLSPLIKKTFIDACGYVYIVQEFGLVGLGVYLGFLKYIGVTSAGLLLLLLATFNVELLTATSFVILAYEVCLNMNRHS